TTVEESAAYLVRECESESDRGIPAAGSVDHDGVQIAAKAPAPGCIRLYGRILRHSTSQQWREVGLHESCFNDAEWPEGADESAASVACEPIDPDHDVRTTHSQDT